MPPATPASSLKSKNGLGRIWRAMRYSWAGLRAAVQHEAAFRQELFVGVPLIVLALFVAPGRWQSAAMIASVVLVWIVELLNSALEALADAISLDRHPLLGRAKDIGSAAVMLTIGVAGLVWAAALWP
jgi:diacylglycerol kinase (ATP)